MPGVAVSTNYRRLSLSEVENAAADCAAAWKNPEIPKRQYDLAVKGELEVYRNGGKVAPFDTLVSCLKRIPEELNRADVKLLDVGASGGYYSEVLRLRGFAYDFTALDFSEAFRDLAVSLYPGIQFKVGDARDLPFSDKSFDIVLNAACLMHCRDFGQVIRSTARVAKKYVIFHRTPIAEGPNHYWIKEAYQIPVLEIWFNEDALLELFAVHGLTVVHFEDVFRNSASGLTHRTYLLEKLR